MPPSHRGQKVDPTMVAEPVVEDMYRGEEGEEASTCRNCGGDVFLDFVEVDDDRWRIPDETCFWQHNDERYTPGQPSPCLPIPADQGEQRG